MKKTNLDNIKQIADMLLYVDIEETEFDMFLIHPFLNNKYMVLENRNEFVNILASEENTQRAREFYSKRINNAESVEEILYLMHKPYRPLLFKLCYSDMSVKDYNNILKEIWTGVENPNQDCNVSIRQWISFFKNANKNIIMIKEEKQHYDQLPDDYPITIYRGVGKGREPYGLSWTENISTAEWFAKRWNNDEAYVLKTQCFKKNIFAYFNIRGEDELVINVNAIKKNNIERIDLNE
jgi:hypothetical protein